LLSGVVSACGYALNGYSWPAGTQITMHLQLSHPSGALQDGSADWNASASDALNAWNQSIDTVKFVAAAPTGSSNVDGANEALFSSTVYGQSWPTNVLAVTLKMSSQGSTFTEVDVLFNDNLQWDSYRGPLRSSGTIRTFDFHRVALHEFGHVLGLDHPDQHGQVVLAQMNSVISDLDSLADDDIAGAVALYGIRITSNLTPPSSPIGQPFQYQVTANNNPTSFEANSLPFGLQVDSQTGRISGTPTAAGTFDVTVIAHGSPRDASATVRIVINGPTITSYLSPTTDVGQAFSYQITASQSASSYQADNLPPGLSFNPTNGLITGTPTVAGTFDITLSAQTNYGAAVATLHLVISPPRIVSASPGAIDIGGNFTYQIGATGQPTSFGATGLPAGLHLDPATGAITGVAELSGNYTVTIVAHTAFGDASAQIRILINARATPIAPVATFPANPASGVPSVSDPYRPRVYVGGFNSITVIDTNSLQIIKSISVPHLPSDLSLSADGKSLWVTYGYYDSSHTLFLLDLDSLNLTAGPSLPFEAVKIREGLDGRLYVAEGSGSVHQVDKTSGVAQPPFWTTKFGSYLEISPDHRTLYVGNYAVESGLGSYLGRIDVSAPTPVVLQQALNYGLTGRSLTLSHNGAFLTFVTVSGGLTQISPSDITKSYGNLPGATDGPSTYSADDTQLYHVTYGTSSISIYNPANGQLLRAIDVGQPVSDSGIVIDATNSYLFLTTSGQSGPARIEAFSLRAPLSTAPPKTLLNVSTRLRSQSGDNALIGGFIVRGSEPKTVVVRAIGPSLPLSGKLTDPSLQLFDSTGALVTQNDNWNAHRTDVLATGLAPTDEHEAVVIQSLPPGSYTAIVSGVGGGTGIAVVEAFDLSQKSLSKLANISTRGRVETGDNVMIGGFIVGCDQLTNVIVRAIGPSLAHVGVPDVLIDPSLELYDSNGVMLASDDNWRENQEQLLLQTGLAPADDREAAIALSLQPGAYTAIVRGKSNSVGVGLVEVYNLDSQ